MSNQNPPPSQTEYYRLIHDVYVLLDDGDRRLLSKFDLTTSQFAVMRLLDLQEGMRLTTLSERVLRSKSTITRIIDYLEEKGIVARDMDHHDRRAQRVVLTPQGIDLRIQVEQAHEESLKDRMEMLSPDQQMTFADLLRQVRHGLANQLDVDEKRDQ